ncbi:MAG: hypothetical protein V7L05_34175 [Nostoc sp.]|uniref:hypothetical protein n=1 Tax=Nostoc sp. TaxID=1180 RepID=UPI002FF4B53C
MYKQIILTSEIDKKLHPQGDGVFGHGEWGIGEAVRSWGFPKWSNCRHGEEVTNALCPMPQAAGRLSLYRHLGMEFSAAFNELRVKIKYS